MEVAQAPLNSKYKSRMFSMVFGDKPELLELYNAVNGTDYTDPELLEVNTLENAIYMSMHNDVSFVINSQLSLYEHQSTYSPNLPLRYLFYISDLYSGMTKDMNLYGSKAVKVPAPRFIIFYNGMKEYPDKVELLLSDCYNVQAERPDLELKATMLNINRGHNRELLEKCRALKDYAEYVARVRSYAEEMDIAEAVERAITECIQEGILREFLLKNRAEAKKMSIYEYDEERHIRQTREEGYEDGYDNGFDSGFDSGFGSGFGSGFDEGELSGSLKICRRLSLSKEAAMAKIMETYSLSVEKAKEMIAKYWPSDIE